MSDTPFSDCVAQVPMPLSDTDELLFRQVHPSLLDGNEPASSVFCPNAHDEGKLSVDRASITTAKDACDLYVSSGRQSVGVYGLTVGEFDKESLPCFADPIAEGAEAVANPAHALVDYTSLSGAQQKKAAKRLKHIAITRGIIHER